MNSRTNGETNQAWRRRVVVAGLAGALGLGWACGVAAQESPPEPLGLKRAVALAVQNSREVALARIQHSVADQATRADRAQFRPNLYTGSGAAYTNGFPQTPNGGAPSVFNVVYSQALLNGPLRGELHATEQRAESQRLAEEAARGAVIVRAASVYLELAKVRHALTLLRGERPSAQKVVDITSERSAAGLELPIELIRAQLTAARIEQRIAQLEGREETLEGELHSLTGLPADQRIEVAAEELPTIVDQPVEQLVELALANNLDLKQAANEQRAREQRLKGEHNGYWPTVDLVGQYSVFSRFNNYQDFYRKFVRHNVTVGLAVRIPVFSARTSAAVSLARAELNATELELKIKQNALAIDVRQQARRARALEAAREVARLELQLAQQNLSILQAQYQEGRAGLRDLEKARLDEHEKWMAFLDAEYDRQQAQLELLRSTGQVARVFP